MRRGHGPERHPLLLPLPGGGKYGSLGALDSGESGCVSCLGRKGLRREGKNLAERGGPGLEYLSAGADKEEEEEEKQDLQGNQKRRKGVLGQLA